MRSSTARSSAVLSGMKTTAFPPAEIHPHPTHPAGQPTRAPQTERAARRQQGPSRRRGAVHALRAFHDFLADEVVVPVLGDERPQLLRLRHDPVLLAQLEQVVHRHALLLLLLLRLLLLLLLFPCLLLLQLVLPEERKRHPGILSDVF